MYKELLGTEARYIHNVVEELNKDSVLLLRVYRNEVDYENNVYTEVDGSKISKLVYDQSVNSSNYMNFGDVSSACIELNLLTKGYSEDRNFIQLFKEFTIIRPYILQSGKIKGASDARLVKVISQIEFETRKDTEDFDKTLDYVTYSVTENDYEYVGYFNYYNGSWREYEYVNEYNEVYNSFPLGKFYVSNLYTNDYYKNLKVTAYDFLGFSDITSGEIKGLKPDINYTDQVGLVNWNLYKNGLVFYDEGDEKPYCDFPTYCSLRLGFGHALVSEIPKRGAYNNTYYEVPVGDGTPRFRSNRWVNEEWQSGSSYDKTADTSVMSNKIYFTATYVEGVAFYHWVKNPVASELSNYYEVHPTYNGSTSSYILFYPSDSVSVRNLISYLALLGTDVEKDIVRAKPENVYNACVGRNGELKFVKYNLIKYRDGITWNKQYLIDYSKMLGLSLDGMPNEKVTVGQARCTSYIVDEETGDTTNVKTVGKSGSSLDFAYPARYPYFSACYALEQIVLLANPAFAEGTEIKKVTIYNEPYDEERMVQQWTANLGYVQELRLIETSKDDTANGFHAYRCVVKENYLDENGENVDVYYWKRITAQLYAYLSGQVTWFGDVNLECGDCITVTDELSNTYRFPIMSMRIEYDGSVKQTLTAKGATDSNALAQRDNTGTNALPSLIKNNYNLISNGIKKVNVGEFAGSDNMAILVDDADLDIPTALILSEFSMNNGEHNWLTEGKVVRIDINGIHRSYNGLRGEFEDIQSF